MEENKQLQTANSKQNSLAKVNVAELETLGKMALESGFFPDLKTAAQVYRSLIFRA